MNALTILLCLGIAPTGALRMHVSGPEAAAPGLTAVSAAVAPAPAVGRDDLPQLPGWPIKVANGMFSPSRGITLADFDADGRPELIMPAKTAVYCWRYDGTPYPGWPVALTGDSCQYAASAADVDLDGDIEVAVSTRGLTSGGAVYLIGENGTMEPGWPFRGSGGNFEDAPTLYDIDGDDTLEVIALERTYPTGKVHVLRHDAAEQPGWPRALDHVPAAGCAVADLDRDGVPEIVAISYNSIYVFEAGGSTRPGWPVTQPNGRNFSYQSPALADVDGDDTLEIATGMHQNGGGCYVFRHDGTIQAGWPYSYASWTYCPPTICDLYRDGELKIVHGIAGGMIPLPVLYAFGAGGSLLPGFPYVAQDGAGAEGNPTVCDVDGDGEMEVIFTSNMLANVDSCGYLCAVHADGSAVNGWPLRPYGFTYLNGATVADVNGDDTMDIIGVSDYGGQLQVSVWNSGVPFNRMRWEWPTYQFNMQRTGLYQAPSAGVAESGARRATAGLRVTPNPVRAGGTTRVSPAGRQPVGLYDQAGRLLAKLVVLPDGRLQLPRTTGPGVYFLRRGSGAPVRLTII